MRTLAYKWLPILFGCHCRSDRSFFYKDKQFPICARCTGELVGILCAPFLFYSIDVPFIMVSVVLMLPMIFDGFLQLLTKYESNNYWRFITGALFGIGIACIILVSTSEMAKIGYAFGKK